MIKATLKRVGITLVQFSSELSISRPTLDNYIETFSAGKEIPNPFFNDIFHFLFDDTSITNEEFLKRYQYMKEHYGFQDADNTMQVSKLKSGFSLPKGEYDIVLDHLVEHIEQSRFNRTVPLETYKLLVRILNNNDHEFSDFLLFFSYLYGYEKVPDLPDVRKKIFTSYYLGYESANNNEPFDESKYQSFVEIANKNFENRHKHVKQLKKEVVTKIEEVLMGELSKPENRNLELSDIIEILKKTL